MTAEQKKSRNRGYALTFGIAICVVLLALFGHKHCGFTIAAILPALGLSVFFGMLMIVNIFSLDPELQKGEMRKAIAASLLAVYFFIIAVTLFSVDSPIIEAPKPAPNETQGSKEVLITYHEEIPEAVVESTTINDMKNQLLKDFTKLMMIVIGFYFGGRTTEELFKTWKGKQ